MGSNSEIQWVDLATDGDQIQTAIEAFEHRASVVVHAVAQKHLAEGSGHRDDPFPRLESHDDYLFGILCLPSSVTDHQADFDELIFVASHDHVLAVTAHGIVSLNPWNLAKRTLMSLTNDSSEICLGGNFLLNVLRVAVEQLREDIVHAAHHIEGLQNELHALVTVHRQRFWGQSSDIERTINSHRLRLGGFRDELLGIKVVVGRTQELIAKLVSDQIDLKVDADGRSRELFDRNLEIHLGDLNVDARHLQAMLDEQHARLTSINEVVLQIDSQEQVTATRFMGAIASIMLLPTFLVGLYGQNFDNMPELRWRFGYLFGWVLIAVLTALQVWFFRRKKWL